MLIANSKENTQPPVEAQILGSKGWAVHTRGDGLACWRAVVNECTQVRWRVCSWREWCPRAHQTTITVGSGRVQIFQEKSETQICMWFLLSYQQRKKFKFLLFLKHCVDQVQRNWVAPLWHLRNRSETQTTIFTGHNLHLLFPGADRPGGAAQLLVCSGASVWARPPGRCKPGSRTRETSGREEHRSSDT